MVFFYLVARRAQDLEVDRLLADQPLEFADLLLRRPQRTRRHHVFVGRHRGLGALGDQVAPALQHAPRDPELAAQFRECQFASNQPGDLLTFELRREQAPAIRPSGNAFHRTLPMASKLPREGVSSNWGSEQ